MMSKPSITTWTRLEPNPTSDNMNPSLEACVYDPAWMLSKQWQLGEFRGEDAGTPIDVSIEVKAAPLVGFKSKNGIVTEIHGVPLEYMAAAEQKGKLLPFEVAEAGMELLNIFYDNNISNEVIENIVNEFPLIIDELDKIDKADSTGKQLLDLLESNSNRKLGLPNVFSLNKTGDKTLEEMLRNTKSTNTPDTYLNIPSSDTNAFVNAACEWIDWISSYMHYSSEECSWDKERMEYSFKAEAKSIDGKSVVLTADEWNGVDLDWYSLDVDESTNSFTANELSLPILQGVDSNYTKIHQGLPTMLTYSGMPNSRWWEFEDAGVNFAQIDCEKNDIARMLVVEFACSYGNDWYLVPMDLPVGAIHTITGFKVTNTFGEVQEIHAINEENSDDWCLFKQNISNNKNKTCKGLLLYPKAYIDKSENIEQIDFFRDEMANLAWAIETFIESSDGRILDRNRSYSAKQKNAVSNSKVQNNGIDVDTEYSSSSKVSTSDNTNLSQQLKYTLVSEIPEHFFPLVPKPPVTPASKPEPIYNMLLMSSDIKPLGEILSSETNIDIPQEEIPSEGSCVTRYYSLSRGSDGRILLSRIRQKKAGRGEGSSGLKFDKAE